MNLEALLKYLPNLLIRAINQQPAGRSSLRIRPGATAVPGTFVDIRLRGGGVLRIGVNRRDRGRIDAWLRSAGLEALIRRSATEAWAIAVQQAPDIVIDATVRLSAPAVVRTPRVGLGR